MSTSPRIAGEEPLYRTNYHPVAQPKEKGKGKCIYIALIFVVHTRRSGMEHTVLPAITSMHAFTS